VLTVLRALPPYHFVIDLLSFIYEYIIYVSAQQITISTTDQNLCLVYFQILPIFLGLPNDTF
jgi:hypothetical protein